MPYAPRWQQSRYPADVNLAVLAAVAIGAAAILALSAAPLSVTRRTGVIAVISALLALASVPLALLALVAVGGAFVVDAVLSQARPSVARELSTILSRAVPSPMRIEVDAAGGTHLRVRQPPVPDVRIDPPESSGGLEAQVIARRRGRHTLPAVAVRVDGPLGLASWYRSAREPAEVLVYPDLPAARRLALAVRQGRFRDPGRLTRGPLGLGTDFESIREYVPDDDVRQVNWAATQRLGKPMSNQYRLEQDRDVVCVVDCGRLMAAPLGDRTRLDAALDAVAAVAFVADEVGDRTGVVAFDAAILRRIPPRRSGGAMVVRAVFDLESSPVDSDYEVAFRAVASGKRALVLVLTDLLDEAAATALLDAVPVLARRHALVIASTTDTDLAELVHAAPQSVADVYAASVALDVLSARARVATLLRHAGADVLEAPPGALANACVGAYLRAKTRARL
jgi:uncharacterized protein (DUF58 family)